MKADWCVDLSKYVANNREECRLEINGKATSFHVRRVIDARGRYHYEPYINDLRISAVEFDTVAEAKVVCMEKCIEFILLDKGVFVVRG